MANIYISDDSGLFDDDDVFVVLVDSAVISGSPQPVFTRVVHDWANPWCGCGDCQVRRTISRYEDTLSRRERKAFQRLSWDMQKALALC